MLRKFHSPTLSGKRELYLRNYANISKKELMK